MTAKELRDILNDIVTSENENGEVWVFTGECAPCKNVGFNSYGDLCISH